jgi:nucleoside-diphosphate-sugar epimerase
MEEIIRRSEKHTIFRVSNPIGITSNVHTILNYLIQHIIQKKSFTLWKYATRNVVDIDHMYSICDYILQNGLFINQVVNVANPVNYPVIEIVDAIEKHFKVDGIYDIEPKSSSPVIDVSPIQALFDKLDISFTADYLENLLTKYYPQSWLTEK